MSALSPSLEVVEPFRPVRADGLPIFRRDATRYTAFYAPGYLCVVDPPDAGRFEALVTRTADWQLASHPPEASLEEAAELRRWAQRATAEVKRCQQEPFGPECLTLYMNNECNLDCVYCYTEPSPQPAPRLDMETIAAAATVVAKHCRRKDRPFYAVFHGGGEPTLHRERVDQALALVEAVTTTHGLEVFSYVATNGVMSEEKAIWLAHRFDLIGLSCDGPASVHDRQRPRWDGEGTLHIVERTGHILQEEGAHIHVRATITAESLHRQAEIAEYLCQQFAPEEIHFEPVYLGKRTGTPPCGEQIRTTGLAAHQAGEYAAHFLAARTVARRAGISLSSSGTRPGSIHGPYCNVFREALYLVPGNAGVASACFKLTDAAQVREKRAAIGTLNRETGQFEVDHQQVQALRQQLDTPLPRCATCFNRYHCARECPDRCPLDDTTAQGNDDEPGFRCRAQKTIASAILQEIADGLWSDTLTEKVQRPHGTGIA